MDGGDGADMDSEFSRAPSRGKAMAKERSWQREQLEKFDLSFVKFHFLLWKHCDSHTSREDSMMTPVVARYQPSTLEAVEAETESTWGLIRW